MGGCPLHARGAGRGHGGDGECPGGQGGIAVAYSVGVPVATGSVTMTDGVARLWFGAVAESAPGAGFLPGGVGVPPYAARHGATMALVKGWVETPGSILRRAGFAAYGQELIYAVSLE